MYYCICAEIQKYRAVEIHCCIPVEKWRILQVEFSTFGIVELWKSGIVYLEKSGIGETESWILGDLGKLRHGDTETRRQVPQ